METGKKLNTKMVLFWVVPFAVYVAFILTLQITNEWLLSMEGLPANIAGTGALLLILIPILLWCAATTLYFRYSDKENQNLQRHSGFFCILWIAGIFLLHLLLALFGKNELAEAGFIYGYIHTLFLALKCIYHFIRARRWRMRQENTDSLQNKTEE